jgi:hypothetical protein
VDTVSACYTTECCQIFPLKGQGNEIFFTVYNIDQLLIGLPLELLTLFDPGIKSPEMFDTHIKGTQA